MECILMYNTFWYLKDPLLKDGGFFLAGFAVGFIFEYSYHKDCFPKNI